MGVGKEQFQEHFYWYITESRKAQWTGLINKQG